MRKKTKAERAALSHKMKAVHAAKRRAAEAQNKGPWPVSLAGQEVVGVTLDTDPEVCRHYAMLARELSGAYSQSAHGKGKERHANGRAFDRQPIMELGRLYGPGFSAGQAAKKSQEALGMASRGDRDKAIFEIHGAIVYLAATAALLREGGGE